MITIAQVEAWRLANHPEIAASRFEVVAGRITVWPDEIWGEMPSAEELAKYDSPVTDVNSPIPAILKGYDDSEAARAERIKLLKSTAAYALGAKLASDLAAAHPPRNAEELEELQATARSQASYLGANFFDLYFGWIGAYREGGGPGFLAAVMADKATQFLDWPTPPGGITLPDGSSVLASGGKVRDLFGHFLV